MRFRLRLAVLCLSLMAVPTAAGDFTDVDSSLVDKPHDYPRAIAEAYTDEQPTEISVARDQGERSFIGYWRSDPVGRASSGAELALRFARKQPSEPLFLHAQEDEITSTESLECSREPSVDCVFVLVGNTALMFWDQLEYPDPLELDFLHSFPDVQAVPSTIALWLLQRRPYFRTSDARLILDSYGYATMGLIDDALDRAALVEDPSDRAYVLSLVTGRLVSWVVDPDVRGRLGPLSVEEANAFAGQIVRLVEGMPSSSELLSDAAVAIAYGGAAEDAAALVLEIRDFEAAASSLRTISELVGAEAGPESVHDLADAIAQVGERVSLLQDSAEEDYRAGYSNKQYQAVLSLAAAYRGIGLDGAAQDLLERLMASNPPLPYFLRALEHVSRLTNAVEELDGYTAGLPRDGKFAALLALISREFSRAGDSIEARNRAEEALAIVEGVTASGSRVSDRAYAELLAALVDARMSEAALSVLDMLGAGTVAPDYWSLYDAGFSAVASGEASLTNAIVTTAADWFVESSEDGEAPFHRLEHFGDFVRRLSVEAVSHGAGASNGILALADSTLERVSNPAAVAILSLRIAETYARLGDVDTARDWARQAVGSAIRVTDLRDRLSILGQLAALYESDLSAYVQLLALRDECVQAITEACAFALAEQVARELLVPQDGFQRVRISPNSTPFTDFRRHPYIARPFANEMLQFVAEQEAWSEHQGWLTLVASLQSLSGDLESAIVTINQVEDTEDRDRIFQRLAVDIVMTLSVVDDVRFGEPGGRRLAPDLLQSALTLVDSIETEPYLRHEALERILSRQMLLADYAGARSTIERLEPGPDRDEALTDLASHFLLDGNLEAAVETAGEIEGETARSLAMTQVSLAQQLSQLDPKSFTPALALDDLIAWAEQIPANDAELRAEQSRVYAHIARLSADLGELEAAFDLVDRIDLDSELRALTFADLVEIVFRADGDVGAALALADAAPSAIAMALAYERVAHGLARQGDVQSARAVMEDAEAISPIAYRVDQTRAARVSLASTWVVLGDIDYALGLAGAGSRNGFVLQTIEELISAGAIESARELLIRSAELGVFAEEDANWSLILSIEKLVDALWSAGNEEGAYETLALGRDVLFSAGDDAPARHELLSLAEVYAYVDDSAGAKELLGLVMDHSLRQTVSSHDLGFILSIASLMHRL